MSTANLALWIALSVFLACFVLFVWDQQRVGTGPPVFKITLNLPESPLDPVSISLFRRFDIRLTNFESETGARLNQARGKEASVRQLRERISFLQAYSYDINNPVAERTQAVAQAEVLAGLLVYTEGKLRGLRFGLPNPTL